MSKSERFPLAVLLATTVVAAPIAVATAAPPARANRIAIAPPPSARIASLDEVVSIDEVFVSDLEDDATNEPGLRR